METKLHQRFLLVNSYGFYVKIEIDSIPTDFTYTWLFGRIRENVYVKIFTYAWFSTLPTLTTYVTWRWKSRASRAIRRRWAIEQVLSSTWDGRPFGHNRYGPKIGLAGGGCAPLEEEELGPHLTQCGQGRGLPVCRVSSWFVQPFGQSHRQKGRQSDRQDNGPIA